MLREIGSKRVGNELPVRTPMGGVLDASSCAAVPRQAMVPGQDQKGG